MKLSSSALVNTFAGTTGVNYDNYIENISNLIVGNSNRDGFARVQYTKISSDKNKIFLKALPLVSIDEIKDLDTNATLTNIEYKINWESGIVSLNYVGNFQIKYTAGYLIDFAQIGTASHTLPEDITSVVAQLVASLYDKSQSASAGGISTNNNILARESVEGQSVSYFNKTGSMSTDNILSGIVLTDYQQSILDNYNLSDYV